MCSTEAALVVHASTVGKLVTEHQNAQTRMIISCVVSYIILSLLLVSKWRVEGIAKQSPGHGLFC